MIINMSRSAPIYNGPPIYTYTGKSVFTDEGNGNWNLKLLTSGKLTISKVGNASKVDIYSVGGGGYGGSAFPISSTYNGGPGGGGYGGDCVTSRSIKMKKGTYNVSVGNSGRESTISLNGTVISRAAGGRKGGDAWEKGPGAHGRNGAGTRNAFGEGPELYGFRSTNVYGAKGNPNTGNGGGGAKTGNIFEIGEPGAGGSGIHIIRNARS